MFYNDCEELININQTTPPESPSDGDWYHIAISEATGDWEGKEGQLAEFREGNWDYFQSDLNISYNQADSKFYEFNSDGTVKSSSAFNDTDLKMWDLWFSPAIVMSNNNNNIMQRCYELLKEQPGFENVVDI